MSGRRAAYGTGGFNSPMADELWTEERGVVYRFHYTEAHLARQIAEDEIFLVGPGARYGPGLYATDLHPDEADPEEIREVCFAGDAAENAFTGVLVLLDGDPLPFEAVRGAPRIFRLPAAKVGESIAVDDMLVGVGERQGSGWRILAWP